MKILIRILLGDESETSSVLLSGGLGKTCWGGFSWDLKRCLDIVRTCADGKGMKTSKAYLTLLMDQTVNLIEYSFLQKLGLDAIR